MRYDPKAAHANLFPEADYDGYICTAEETVSKKGNPMMKVAVEVWGNQQKVTITDYFLADKPTRLKKLCTILGIDFDAGEVTPEMLIGQNVGVHLKIQEDDTGRYDDKNVIAWYFDQKAKAPVDTSGVITPGLKESDGPPEDDPF